MSGISGFREFSEAVGDGKVSEAPLFGAASGTGGGAPGVPETLEVSVRYFQANLSDEGDRNLLEHIMTTSLRGADQLTKVGNIMVIREDSTFDREGNYMVAVKYCEVVSAGAASSPPSPAEPAPLEESFEIPQGVLPTHDF